MKYYLNGSNGHLSRLLERAAVVDCGVAGGYGILISQMKTWKKLSFFAILLFFGTASYVSAADTDSRYFVKSNSNFWKKSFGVRHEFDGGFTTDLTDFQIGMAKVFKVEIEPVRRLNILATQVAATRKAKSAPKVPTSQVPWGVALVNGESTDFPSGGKGVSVAVLDTGVNRSHPDLKNRVKICRDFASAASVIDGKCDDRNGHGTHVAGIIAADGGIEGKGIYGVAPETNLFIYKTCSNSGTCYSDDVASALRNAADSGAQIINLSIGSDNPSGLVADALGYVVEKGVLVIAAAGNDGPYQGSIDFPAADARVVGVGAIDPEMVIPTWSARGINSTTDAYVSNEKDIEFAAPGVNTESTWKDGDYAILPGTSMSAPHVVGLAAKLWQSDATSPANATRRLLRELSRDIGLTGDDDASGWGLPRI